MFSLLSASIEVEKLLFQAVSRLELLFLRLAPDTACSGGAVGVRLKKKAGCDAAAGSHSSPVVYRVRTNLTLPRGGRVIVHVVC